MNKNTLLWSAVLYIMFSCQNPYSEEGKTKSVGKSEPPQITWIADLPDSLKPKVHMLADMPKPNVLKIPKAGGKPIPYTGSDGKTYQVIHSVSKILPAFESRKEDIEKGKIKIPFNSGEGGKLPFTNYTVEDGLANDNLSCAIVDKRGDIWFGTHGGGVSRFDGKHFNNYTIENGLTHNRTYEILEDHTGNIWITTSGGLTRYDGQNFTSFTEGNGLPYAIVWCLAEDKYNKLWIGTIKGLYRYDPDLDSITNKGSIFAELVNKSVTCLYIDRSGNIWMGTSKGLTVYDPESQKIVLSDKDGFKGGINSVYQDKSGKMWINEYPHIVCYDFPSRTIIATYTVSQGLAGGSIPGILEDQSGNLWFATNNGVSCLEREPSGNGYQEIFSLKEMEFKDVRFLLPDSAGNIWMGTNGNGVYRFDFSRQGVSKSFTTFNEEQGLGRNPESTLYEDKSGIIWFGLSRFNGTHLTFFSTKDFIWTWGFLLCILEDHTGKIWFGGGSIFGFGVYDRNAGSGFESMTNYFTKQGLAGNVVWCATEDRKGHLWIGSEGGGASYFDGIRFINYTVSQGFTNALIDDIQEDRAASVWFATTTGLYYFDPAGEGTYIRFSTSQGLSDNHVRSILEDRLGNLWFGSDRGLSFISLASLRKIKQYLAGNEGKNSVKNSPEWQTVFKSGLFKSFTMDDGLPDNFIMNLAELPEGKIVMGSSTGLSLFTFPADTTGNFSSLGKIEVFSSVNGFPVKDIYRGQNRLLVDSRGILWAGTSSQQTGVVRFDYSSLVRREVKPILNIRQVRIKEEPVPWHTLAEDFHKPEIRDLFFTPGYISEEIHAFGRVLGDSARNAFLKRYNGIRFSGIERFYPVPQNLKLAYKHNRIVIVYGADELARTQLMEYQYKLEGYDREWSPVIKTTSATFGNMKEGKYTFLVKARYTGPSVNGADEWTQPVSYTFRVLPPWYRSWLAYLVYTALIVLIVWQIYRFQKERLLRAEREKAQTRELEHAHEIEKAQAKELEQAHEIEKAYHELKTTQTQLIYQEKMASLGELTAGIAHEIQNPLNFVNNFSEISSELIEEMNEELDKGDIQDARETSEKIRQNLGKINQHGKRADAIVKGMLQHSRTNTGQKEPTNINALADEYLRLAYHGMRAKEKIFNADFKIDFDPDLPKISVVPQEIGRVLLNLINNAFYAVDQRERNLAGPDKETYKPVVIVSTKNLGNQIEISVKDNGAGIPEEIKNKIFQPFFTTKPTGQGTGLGLSLAYDMVKAHGGEIQFSSVQGEGSEFKIILPFSNMK
jgi:signal transduction histidine kinase/ligand-binding sensor domain-containing protein